MPSQVLRISPRKLWNDTGLEVTEGELLRFAAKGRWVDLWFSAGASGYQGPAYMRGMEPMRRCPTAAWFELIGCIDQDDSTSFPIGSRPEVRVPRSGRLSLYANDVRGYYWNNWGALIVTIG